jgi:Protein of unknown function (DUF2752)
MTLTTAATAPSLRVRLSAPLATGAAVLGGFALVGLVDPHQPGHYPVCPTWSVLGVYCPLCGGLRAANDLAHGNLAAAAGSNLLFLVALPLMVVAWGLWIRDRARGSTRDLVNLSSRQLWVITGVMVVFMVVRNLPWGASLAP